MTASREFNFEAFAAKFDASLLKLLTAEVLTTKRSRRFLSGFIGTSRKYSARPQQLRHGGNFTAPIVHGPSGAKYRLRRRCLDRPGVLSLSKLGISVRIGAVYLSHDKPKRVGHWPTRCFGCQSSTLRLAVVADTRLCETHHNGQGHFRSISGF